MATIQQKPAVKVGLTGGIACGKSTAVKLFREKGIAVIDADAIAKQIVKPNQPTLSEIIQLFGCDILQEDGRLDRMHLREIVFDNKKKLLQLEAILHPKIRAEIQKKMEEESYNNVYVIVDVPLLIEQNYQTLFDQVIVVDCTLEQQTTRAVDRDGVSLQQLQSILSLQVSREQRLAIADNILDNSGSLDKLREQVDTYHNKLVHLGE